MTTCSTQPQCFNLSKTSCRTYRQFRDEDRKLRMFCFTQPKWSSISMRAFDIFYVVMKIHHNSNQQGGRKTRTTKQMETCGKEKKDPATRPPGHAATWPPDGQPATQPPGYPATRPPQHTATWPRTQPLGHSAT